MLNASLLQGRVSTAGSILEWFQLKVARTHQAWKCVPLLLAAAYLNRSVIRRIEKEGISNIDPFDAKVLGDALQHGSDAIRRVLAGADAADAYEHLPFRLFLPILKKQGHELRRFASTAYRIADEWQETISSAAKDRIDRARLLAMEHLDVIDQDFSDVSDDELRAHLHHTLTNDR